MTLQSANDGVYKSSLMDSKPLPGNAGDNEGQAGRKPVQPERASEKTLETEMQCAELYGNIES